MTARTLRVQTVLYGTEPAQVWRLSRGLRAAAYGLLAAEAVTAVEWALGDSSPHPVVADGDVQGIQELTSPAIAPTTYDFFDANLGSSGGQNRLAAGSRSDLLLVLNPDTYPAPNALTELVRAIDQPKVGIVEARQIPLEHPRRFDPVTGETSWASGYCMMVRRSVFDLLKGFDDDHFLLHCDDVDLSWRARASGWKVVTAPRAVVFHDKRPRYRDAWPAPDTEVYHGTLGRLVLATRWDRADIVEETAAAIEAGGAQTQIAALAEFKRRKVSGELPSTEANAQAVAQFIDGEYADHRF